MVLEPGGVGLNQSILKFSVRGRGGDVKGGSHTKKKGRNLCTFFVAITCIHVFLYKYTYQKKLFLCILFFSNLCTQCVGYMFLLYAGYVKKKFMVKKTYGGCAGTSVHTPAGILQRFWDK